MDTNSRPELKLDWCSYEAAKYAVEHWHYSRSMPTGKLVRIGVWETGVFVGCLLFGRGATTNIGSPYGLDQTEVCELTRVALTEHCTPVSRIVAIGVKMLRRQSPGVRLLVSYADPEQGHYGGIYKAGNWIYTGLCDQTGGALYLIGGKWVHTRTLGSKYGTRSLDVLDRVTHGAERKRPVRKHKYLYPLDDAMRKQIAPLAKPYPKRANYGSGARPDTSQESGSIPTSSL